MKLNNIKNIEKLFEVIDNCKGNVYMVGEGISINLKSKLSQYFSLAQVFASKSVVEEIELMTDNVEDTKRLLEFMVSGDTTPCVK